MLIATVLFGAILCAALLFYGCGDNPSTDVKDAVFDQSVMFISGELDASPEQAAHPDRIDWVESIWKNDGLPHLVEGCWWTRHASWPVGVEDPASIVGRASSIVKSETNMVVWDAGTYTRSEVSESTTSLVAAINLSSQCLYVALADNSVDVWLFAKRC